MILFLCWKQFFDQVVLSYHTVLIISLVSDNLEILYLVTIWEQPQWFELQRFTMYQVTFLRSFVCCLSSVE